jgi:signal peptide peptidase SppA
METPTRNKFFAAVALSAAIGSAIAIGVIMLAGHLIQKHADAVAANNYDPAYGSDTSCNVLGIQVHGEIVSSRADIPLSDTQPVQQGDGSTQLSAPNYAVANEIEDALRNAAKDDSIKAILVDVDSPGGGVVSGQEIANAIRKSGKYSVSIIHEIGASAGYLSAAAAYKVYAGQDSEVGSIGVTASFLNQYQKDQQDGIVYEQLSSGTYKDTFSPDKPLTADEKALILRDVNESKEDFVQLVAQYRNIPVPEVEKLADGSTMLGKDAVKSKLIDGVGTTWDALDDIQQKIGEPVSLCWQ